MIQINYVYDCLLHPLNGAHTSNWMRHKMHPSLIKQSNHGASKRVFAFTFGAVLLQFIISLTMPIGPSVRNPSEMALAPTAALVSHWNRIWHEQL